MIKTQLNLGAGSDIRKNFVNHDIVELEGIDETHDLNQIPWPWSDDQFDLVAAYDVLEHLDDFVGTMEELHRILKPGGTVDLVVPYWNSSFRWIDPTHMRGFHESTFNFFDPRKQECTLRNYYSHARFEILSISFVIMPFSPYFNLTFGRKIRVKNSFMRRFVGLIGNSISNLILDLEVELKCLK